MSIVGIVPAAGLSRRMGRPKLTLPLGDRSVISHVVESLRLGGAGRVIVVIRPSENPAFETLQQDARNAGAEVSICDPPPDDMRASVEHAIAFLDRHDVPPAGILLCPGDSPGISARLVQAVIDEFIRDPLQIVTPECDGKGGHPVAIPWDLARSIASLPPGIGVNGLRARYPDRQIHLPVRDEAAFTDLDTPQDYRAWLDRIRFLRNEG